MADYGTRYTDKQTDLLNAEIAKVYKEAQADIQRKMNEFYKGYAERARRKKVDLDAGKITLADYQSWLRGQVFQSKRWKDKRDNIAKTLTQADKKAAQIINKRTPDVFRENANYTAYDIERGMKGGVSFNLYDSKSVERLIEDKPELLPRRVVDGRKADAWNTKEIANAVSQGIIEGESIPQLAKRIARDTGIKNGNSSMLYARTAMTGAQNAGRQARLEDAQDMGVEVKKKWLATLDNRTRDTHQKLDGQEVAVDEPFQVDKMKIDYPGDPTADPSMVYNCRCTLIYVYPKYQHLQHAQRRDQEAGKLIENMTYKQWAAMKQPKQETKILNALDIFKEKRNAFVPAKNLAEAEAALSQYVDTKGFGALGVSYKGISLDSANEINRTLIALQETFDVDKFGGIVAPAKNTKLGKQIQDAVAGWSPIRKSYVLNRDMLKTVKVAEERFQRERHFVTDILNHPENYDLTKASSGLKRIIEHSKVSGRGTVPESIAETMSHEFGHSIEGIINKDPHFDEIKNNMMQYAPKISGYAHESISEYIAESMASYLKGEDVIDPILRNVFESIRRK